MKEWQRNIRTSAADYESMQVLSEEPRRSWITETAIKEISATLK